MSNVPALVVEGLGHRFGPRRVLKDVSFSIAPGDFTVLLGLNGAGKTTLFSLATRLYAQAEGTIRIFGMDIREQRLECLRQMGIVFQAADPRSRPLGRAELVLPLRLARPCSSRSRSADGCRNRPCRSHRSAPGKGAAAERRPAPPRRDRPRSIAPTTPVVARRADGRARHRQPAVHARPCPPAVPRAGPRCAMGHPSDRRAGRGRAGRRVAQGEVLADGAAAQLLGEMRAPSMRAVFETLVQEREAA